MKVIPNISTGRFIHLCGRLIKAKLKGECFATLEQLRTRLAQGLQQLTPESIISATLCKRRVAVPLFVGVRSPFPSRTESPHHYER